MSVDWLRFHPDLDAKLLYVDILVGKLLEVQPDSMEETDKLCESFYPALDKIRDVCLEHNLRQVCSCDLADIDVNRLKPLTIMRIIWNVYEHTKSHFLLARCDITHSNSIFGALYTGVKGFLPPFVRNLIRLS
jgi:hypothetical protein